MYTSQSLFTDIGYHALMIQYKRANDELESTRDITIDNNIFNGCGISSFWSVACIWFGGYDNMTLANNEITNNPFSPVNIKSTTPHGKGYWEDNGVVDPQREDYVFHIEFNHIYNYGLQILSDMGSVHMGEFNFSEFYNKMLHTKYMIVYFRSLWARLWVHHRRRV